MPDIKLYDTEETVTGCIPVSNINEIDPNKRMFYELGHYRGRKWVRTGLFKEIKDVQDMLENDKRLVDTEYIKHHNFVIQLD